MAQQPLICFRLPESEKQQIQTLAELNGIKPSDIYQNYTRALLAGEAKILPPRGQQVAYQD